MLAPLVVPSPFADLDHNATSAMAPCAVAAHALGQRLLALGVAARPLLLAKLMARCRWRIAQALGAQDADVWLTSGGTEANALALAAAMYRCQQQGRTAKVVHSALEHPSVMANVAQAKAHRGVQQTILATDANGQAQPPGPADWAAADWVSVMFASNETGVIQPVHKVMAPWAGTGAWRHSDAVQAVGRLPINFAESSLDLMTLAGHKIGAGHGIGALIARRGLGFVAPPLFGAQTDVLGAWSLPGGRHLPLVMALAAAITEAQSQVLKRAAVVGAVRDAFEQQLNKLCGPVMVLGHTAPRLPNTSCVRFVGCSAETLLIALDVRGLGVSLGSACSSGVSTPSATVRAMGLRDDEAREVLRISWPMAQAHDTLAKDSARLLAALAPLCAALRG